MQSIDPYRTLQYILQPISAGYPDCLINLQSVAHPSKQLSRKIIFRLGMGFHCGLRDKRSPGIKSSDTNSTLSDYQQKISRTDAEKSIDLKTLRAVNADGR